MAQQRKKTKTKSKKTTQARTRKTSRKKKSKVYIPIDKILILCSIVVIMCTLLLFVNAALEANIRQDPVSVPKENVVQKTNSTQTQKSSNSENNNSKVTEKSKSVQNKNEESKKPVVQQDDKQKPKPVVEEKKEVVSKYDYLPNAVNNAKLVFVFDDAGQNMSHLEKFVTLPFPVTIAVLPKLQYSRAAADKIRSSGKELMLHQPMQALNLNVNPGPGAITPDMSLYEIEALVKENISEVGPIKGMNNHEGSLITEDENRISVVMQTLSDMGLYFLDSRTTSQTRVPQAAMSLGLSYYERNVFIDNTQNLADMVKEIEKGLDIANKNGHVIMIGHVWSFNTLPNILMELYPVLVKKGYKFATVSNSGGLITP